MKQKLLICFTALFAVLLSAAPSGPLPTLKRPPRKVVINKAKTAAQLSADNTVIVLDAKASPAIRFAAAQLQEMLSQILGKQIPVSTQADKTHNIYVGDSTFARKNGVDFEKLPRDGFIIKTVGKDIIIA